MTNEPLQGRKPKRVGLVMVLLLCLVTFLCGVIAAGPLRRLVSWGEKFPGADATPSIQATEVIEFTPWTVAGIGRGLTTSVISGSCWGPSNLTGRSDAYRCVDGASSILDPCFEDVFHRPARQVACPSSQRSVAVINLSEDLPSDKSDAGREPWLLVLADGRECYAISGATMVLRGERQSYACSPGDGELYGYPDNSGARWTTRYAANGGKNLKTVPIVKAYE